MSASTELKVGPKGGDDLDDGLEYGLDDVLGGGGGASDDEGELLEINEDDLTWDQDIDGTAPSIAPSAKRQKLEAGNGKDLDEMTPEERNKEKKRRNKEKMKEKRKTRAEISSTDADSAIALSPSTLPLAEFTDYLHLNQKLSLSPILSNMELEDWILSESCLIDSSGFKFRLSQHLSMFVKALLPPIPSPTKTGSPTLLILASSGQRCADLVRELRPILPTPLPPTNSTKSKKRKVRGGDLGGSGEIAKLFAKHFKVSEHVKYLDETKISIAVGTPHRVAELLSAGALTLPSGSTILLDLTPNSKKQTLLSLPECKGIVWQKIFSINEGGLGKRLKEGDLKLIGF